MNRQLLFSLLALSLPFNAFAPFQAKPQSAADAPPASPKARNVILFIGDGMGILIVTAARSYHGQSRGERQLLDHVLDKPTLAQCEDAPSGTRQ